ncbi:MAG: substrate-binding domain-containing protein [Calothrix sp. FI2-JRJ7]|jgi:serine/threonine protein kinase|nr:substrate-binding domain-containing protein [Calothrix sp. FI2-JRJ7]
MSSTEFFYKQYSCSYNSPLDCERIIETLQEVKGAKFCFECGFPTFLPEEAEIKGYRGSYQVTKFLGVRGFGRLYSGIQLKDKQPVIIKEYLLPSRTFNQDETFKRKETFRRIGGVELADGRVQNFRLIQTWEAISPETGERCYLITKDVQPSQTLRQYLKQNGAMAPSQVREFLNQVLQTLEFLHSQKLRFPSNQIQNGLEHGNINLDSILIKKAENENKQKFLVYLCDVSIWENLFIPPTVNPIETKTRAQDLESLGLVAFQLWVGQTQLDYKDHQAWPNNDDYLKQFLYHLLSLNAPYGSAEIARQELNRLPKPDESNNLQASSDSQELKKKFPKYWLWLTVLAFLLLGSAIWYYFWQRSKPEEYLEWRGLVQNFSKVDNVPSGKFTYTGEKNDTWSFILTQASDDESRLKDVLNKPKPEVEATFNYQDISSGNNITTGSQPIQEVLNGKKDFAITSLEEFITINLNKERVAYDGLLVFVAFSQNNSSLPKALNGNISLEQLRQIYTGRIKDWRQIDSSIESIPIEPYVPTELEAKQQFKKLVLNNNQQDIALFENIPSQNTGTTQNRMREAIDTGKPTGIISFGVLSKTWNQCSGYPLAIVGSNNQPIQPLYRSVQRRQINSSDDLCDKANYFAPETFRAENTANYPLGYPLYVVYPKDNTRSSAGSTFADMLKTRQGQCLLNKVGLVPLQPMPNDINYACKSVP